MFENLKPLACGFHSHAEQSLDGGSTSERKILNASSLGMIADCLTDHGIMNGLADQWAASKKTEKMAKEGKIPHPIMAIQGIEAYIIDEHRPAKVAKNGKVTPQYYHLTIHFKTMNAYFHFCKLSRIAEDRAVVKFGERKPLIYLSEIWEVAGEITVGSGCLMSPVQKNILNGNPRLAEQMYLHLRHMAGPENFYVEVFPHIIDHEWKRPVFNRKTKKIEKEGYFEPITKVKTWDDELIPKPEVDPCTGTLDIQKAPNQFVLDMANKHNDKVVISLDDHYGPLEDKLVQEARLSNGFEAWKFFGSYETMTSQKAAEQLTRQLNPDVKDIEKWIDNSYQFTENFKEYKFPDRSDQTLLPSVEMVYGAEYASEKSNMDILWDKLNAHGILPKEGDPKYQEYHDRLLYEIEIVANNDSGIDFLPYFFLLEDLCNYARRNKILGTSRGSGGGSLLLFGLGIVITDPIKYGLSFERFLNPGRISSGSWPDVDLDWENRTLIVDFLKEKYQDKFALISNDGKMKIKSSILDIERGIRGSVSESTMKMTKKIKVPMGADEKQWLLKGNPKKGEPPFIETDDPVAIELRQYAKDNPDIWAAVILCIGIVRQKGVHAGGVIITPGPVNEFMPVIRQNKGEEYVTAYNMHGVEDTGGIKYDILGLKTLLALSVSMKMIEADTGIDIKWGEFPEDKECADNIVNNMKLEGIFQLNTAVTRPFMTKVRPSDIIKCAALTALCRPGALDADSPDPNCNKTAAEYYVDVATGSREPYYIHEDLKPILEETHGVIVYQEQAIRIGVELAGYTEGHADILIRKGIGKKIESKIKEFSDDLQERLPARGWSNEQIEQLIQNVKATAKYSFNKCFSGDEIIKLAFDYNEKTLNIREMFNDESNEYGRGLSMTPGGHIISNKIVDIRFEGIRDIYRLTTESDKIVDATDNHKFPTPKGEKMLQDLKIGDELFVAVDDSTVTTTEKIKNIAFIKTDDVYDVEMAAPHHNLVMNSGIVASNSHSVSYAIVAWNCIWMKHNYPQYYWAGMMTAFADKDDQISGFLKECGDILLPPKFGKSAGSEWKAENEGDIRMPMSIIKGCGTKGCDALYEFSKTLDEDINWLDFCQKLKEAKKNKTSKGISAGTLVRLIYAGAFDHMIDGEITLDIRNKMFFDVKQALVSVIDKPSAPKGEVIGIKDITNDLELDLWRHSVNPLIKFDFISRMNEFYSEKIKMVGFETNNKSNKEFEYDFPYVCEGGLTYFPLRTGLIRSWNRVFDDKYKNLYDMVRSKKFGLALFGVVVSVKRTQTKNGKNRISVDFFNGEELIRDMTIWPNYHTGLFDEEMLHNMIYSPIGLISVIPNLWNGNKQAQIVGWKSL